MEEAGFGDIVGDLRLRVVDNVAGDGGDEEDATAGLLRDHVSVQLDCVSHARAEWCRVRWGHLLRKRHALRLLGRRGKPQWC